MAFVKELVSEADKELYQSFQMYDYNHNTISGLKLYTNWAVDRERKIYFTYVSGGALIIPNNMILSGKEKRLLFLWKFLLKENNLKIALDI